MYETKNRLRAVFCFLAYTIGMNQKERFVLYGSYTIAAIIPWITFSRWVFTHATSKTFLFYGAVSIIASVWVYLYIADVRYRFTKREWWILAPLIAYTLWMVVSTFTARDPGLALWGSLMRGVGLLTVVATALYTIMIVSLAKRHEGYIQRFLGWSVVGGAVTVASVWFGDEGFNLAINVLRKGSGGGVTGNSSLAGAYSVFMLGFSTFLIASNRYKNGLLWVLVSAILLSPLFINVYGALVGKGVIGSARGALGGIIIGAVVGALVYGTLSLRKSIRSLSITGIIAGVVAGALLWNQLVTPGTNLHQKFIDVASGTRFAFWEISQKALNERPFVGYGIANFPIAQARYFDPQFLSKSLAFEAWTDQPHNVYYNNAIAGGYPAVLLYVVLIGTLIYTIYRSQSLGRTHKAILVGTLVGYLVQDLVAFDGFITMFAFATYIGVVYGYAVSPSSTTQSPQDRKWYLYVFVVLCLIGIVGAYEFSYRPVQKAKLFAEVLGSKLNERYPRYQEFLKGSPVGNYWDVGGFGYDEYKLYARDPLAVKQDPKLLSHAIKDVDAYITYLEQVAQTNKTDYRLYFTIINLYNTKIYFSDLPYDPVLAARITNLIDYASTLAPTDPRLYWMRAQLAAWKGDLAGVVGAYQKAIAIDPTLPVSHKLLIQFLQGVGNQKLYKEALDAAQKDIPGFTMQ
jgi:O-antigen ligase